jgi:chromosomal replication initiation ATPase DnaA
MRKETITKYGESRLDEGLSICTKFWGVSREDILGKSRLRRIVNARHSLRYYLTMSNDLSLAEIGTLTQGDHSSVIHSKTIFNTYCEYEEDFRAIKRIMKGEIKHSLEVGERTRLGEILRSGESVEKKTNLIINYYENQ